MERRVRRRLLAFGAAALVAPLIAVGAITGGASAATNGRVVGYFTEWGVYQRNYHVKNIDTSGSATKLTHINYAFGNVQNGQCTIGDSYADYDKFYDAASSVDGQADSWDAGALRGNFNQLRKLKKKYPNLKVLWSFGGWTWSGGFGQAAQNPSAFADSCYKLVEDSRWADVFDGIDIDWEYPNACGLSCDSSGSAAYKNLMQALRSRFGSGNLVTSAITADASSGGKIEKADYAGAAQYVDWYNPMTYDFFGAWDASGPTAPHSPLRSYTGIPKAGYNSDAAIQKLKGLGIPSSKLLLGIGFYGRGWTGVTQDAPGGSATGPAPGTYEQGIEDYKVLKGKCPANGTVAGTAYAKCGSQWWSYDTPSTIAGKMAYANDQALGGSFFWELSGDTSNGELIGAIKTGLGGGGTTGGTTTGGTTGDTTTGGTTGGTTSGGTTTGGTTTGGGGTCPTAWSSTVSYVPNDVVSYKSHKYTSTWYSTGAVPDDPSSWAVWRDDGAC